MQSLVSSPPKTCVFLDIGGVMLTNGWDHIARRRAARKFELDWKEMEQRHKLTFEIFENGYLTLEEYLNLVIFHKERSFTSARFQRFIFAQSKPFPEMLALAIQLKRKGLKIAVVSNESREINAHRIHTFQLDQFVDAFVSSCFVHIRKPHPDIFRMALDIVQAKPEQVIYIENTPMFVQIAQGLGIQSILHTDYQSTRTQLDEAMDQER